MLDEFTTLPAFIMCFLGCWCGVTLASAALLASAWWARKGLEDAADL